MGMFIFWGKSILYICNVFRKKSLTIRETLP